MGFPLLPALMFAERVVGIIQNPLVRGLLRNADQGKLNEIDSMVAEVMMYARQLPLLEDSVKDIVGKLGAIQKIFLEKTNNGKNPENLKPAPFTVEDLEDFRFEVDPEVGFKWEIKPKKEGGDDV